MASKLVAQVLLCRCSRKGGKLFGITLEQRPDGDMDMIYSYPLDEARAKSEGYGGQLTADIYKTDAYPGCPYCRRMSIVHCGDCGKFTCHTDGDAVNTCGWCGVKMDDIAYRGKLDFDIGPD